ncbi:ExeM/NucH family extracellular endonuclease [Modestobacter marinus]|uniref:ExeM/NucH family extracellular endonuclease n=1 Tax=Modestobacter marinus TaxID=477641 RepID=UPI001C9551F9|nr:ExeM/NucH family extracellular endonuclease [Modestobacter marinus]
MSERRALRVAVPGLTVAVAVAALAAGVTAFPVGAAPVDESCTVAVRSIGSVQGSDAASPVVGQQVTVAGTVVGDLQDGGFDGVFVQDGGDGTPATSDAVFVYGAGGDLALGDEVVVRGTVAEFDGLTELTDPEVAGCGTAELPAPASLPMPSGDAEREALEGMLVAPSSPLTVTGLVALDRFGELLLSSGGRLLAPTEAAEPGPAAAAVAAENETRSILLDDARTANLTTTRAAPPHLTLDDPVRVGDAVDLEPVVLGWGHGAWRLQPADGTAAGTTFPAVNARPAEPPAVGGDLVVGDFNVLNYFVDFPSEFGDLARGAEDADELARQEAKIVRSITALDADVLTLHEIENSAVLTPATPYRAVETLLAALEDADGHDWRYVRAHEDTDVITNAIVYRADRVVPVGDPAVPADLSAFANARSPIAQTFSAGGDLFTVIANHLKSKGSACGAGSDDPAAGGNGNCNGDRVAQAQALVAFAAERASAAGDPDLLLTGDFNAYRHEDPIDVVTAAGWTELVAPDQHSYVFDGGSGSLDHIFASPSLAAKVTGHAVWDVNASESSAYQYDGDQRLYSRGPYRASDHNPTLVGIDIDAAATISDATPFRGDRVTVTGTGFLAGEQVTASLPSRNQGLLGSGTADAHGRVAIAVTVPATLPAGGQQVELRGTSGESASTGFEVRPLVAELLERLIGWFTPDGP